MKARKMTVYILTMLYGEIDGLQHITVHTIGVYTTLDEAKKRGYEYMHKIQHANNKSVDVKKHGSWSLLQSHTTHLEDFTGWRPLEDDGEWLYYEASPEGVHGDVKMWEAAKHLDRGYDDFKARFIITTAEVTLG